MKNLRLLIFRTLFFTFFTFLLFSSVSQAQTTSSGHFRARVENTKNGDSAFSLERRIFDLINRKRAEYGLPSLNWSERAAQAARLHSRNMASYSFFSHTGTDGKRVDDRADAVGLRGWRLIGENIAFNRGFSNPAERVVERWMLSPSHRDNLLNSRWSESGVGVTITSAGTYYFTQVFVKK